MKDKIKWPAGNRLDLCIPLRKITVTEEGTQFGEYIPPQAAAVMVYLVGNYASYEYTPRIEDNKLYISDNGELKPGVYAIDVRIQEPERKLRSFRCGELEIVRETKQLALGDFVLDNNITLDADAFIFGEGPSAYEVAVRDGYMGTKAEWLESMRGKEGRGIADIVALPTGAFRILLTDGSAYVTPILKGEQGVSIVDFTVSSITSQEVICTITMSDGTTRQLNLPRGEKGEQGDAGEDGRGIQSVVMNNDYTITFSYTDGTSYTTPQALRGEKGENGQDGQDGQDGRGISSMAIDDDNHLTVSYSDGTTYTTPQSLQGERGVSITDFEQVGESATMTFFNIYYSNGNISQIGLPKGEQGDRGEQGPQGIKGDTVVLGEVGEYKLYNVGGTATDGAMTQDATTKAIAAAAGYYECGTAAGTAAKIAIGDNEALYTLQKGGSIKVKMTNANAAASGVTLKIGSAAATPLYYNGAAVSASNTWEADEVIEVYYDGTNYQASNAQGGGGKAEKIKYDNSQSGLAEENVQGALDEVAGKEIEDAILVTYDVDLPANATTFYPYNLRFEQGEKYRFVLEFDSEPTANIVSAISASSSVTTDRIVLHTTRAGESRSEFCYVVDSETYQYLYWYSTVAHSFTMKIYKICDRIDLTKTNIEEIGKECSLGQETEIKEASRYSWNINTGAIGTTETIRAHMRIDAIGCRQISVTIPEGYYACFYYVDEDDIMKGVVDFDWNSGTVTFNVNGLYDIMGNIKYGSAGTTTITQNMLKGVEWTISRIYDSFSPAAPYFDVIQATGGAMDLSDKIKIGNVSGNTPQTTTKIRAYYKLVNAPKGIIKASVNDGYYVTIIGYNGVISTVLSSEWLQEQKVVNNGYDTIWFSFKYGNNADFTPAIAKAAGFMFEFEPFPDSSSVMAYNSDKHTKMASLCRRHHSWPGHGYYHTYKYFTFAQITDTHAVNMTVKRAVEYLNECKDIDMLLHTGDIQRKSFNDETAVSANTISEFMTYLKMAEKPFLLSLGNHDQNGANGSAITLSKMYDRFMQPMVDKGWLTENVNIDTENNATWYYKDFDKYGIRVISLNSFDPLYDGYYTSKGMDDNYLKFSQSQITWLVNTLQDVPEGYHVVVALHTPYDSVEGDYPTIINSDWSSTAKNNAGTHGSGQPTHLSGNPMLDVLAAYKEKTTVTGTYSYDESAVQAALGSITVDADFTNAEGVLAFMVIGHNHDDWVGEFQSKANIKCVCMAGSMLTEPDSDLGRGQNEGLLTEYSEPIPQLESKLNGKAQDAINVYIVRTDLRKVYIIRMGADFTTDARDRVLTSFEY